MGKQIPLTKGKFALVDDDDFDAMSQYKWQTSNSHGIWYAVRKVKIGEKRLAYLMHREILGFPVGMEVDHIDHDGLNNTRSNLRICTHQQNISSGRLRNHSSKFRGVSWYSPSEKWRAQIKVMGVKKSIGYFVNESDAALAYNQSAKSNFGEFAVLNDVQPDRG
jgi:hypothetical protein